MIRTCTSFSSRDGALGGYRSRSAPSGLEDEREGDTEDGERLGDGHAEEGDGLQHAAGLGLAGDTIDVGREDEADTDAGADGREAVTEDGNVAGLSLIHI